MANIEENVFLNFSKEKKLAVTTQPGNSILYSIGSEEPVPFTMIEY